MKTLIIFLAFIGILGAIPLEPTESKLNNTAPIVTVTS